MAVSKEAKESILDELKDRFGRAKSVVFTRNDGITVSSIENIRKAMRAEKLEHMVAKKTLIKIALKENGIEDVPVELMDGPIGLTFGYEDEIAAPRVVKNMNKDEEHLALVGAVIGTRVIGKEELIALASLPGHDELIAMLIGRLKSPISGFTNVIAGTGRGFTRVLKAIAEQKQGA